MEISNEMFLYDSQSKGLAEIIGKAKVNIPKMYKYLDSIASSLPSEVDDFTPKNAKDLLTLMNIKGLLEDMEDSSPSQYDEMTGLLTKASFYSDSVDMIAQMSNNNTTTLYDKRTEENICSLIMFDLDYFKAVNDVLGHLQGDQVISDYGSIIHHSLNRESDVTGIGGRVGGEEIQVLLPYTNAEGAAYVAHKIKDAINTAYFAAVNKDGRKIDGKYLDGQFKISATIGVATHKVTSNDQPEEVLKELQHGADTALNYGKFKEKGTVYSYDTEVESQYDLLEKVRSYFIELPNEDAFIEDALFKDCNLSSQTIDYIADNISDIQKFSGRDTRTKAMNADVIYKNLLSLTSEDELKSFYDFIEKN